jgi:hypothetical protein
MYLSCDTSYTEPINAYSWNSQKFCGGGGNKRNLNESVHTHFTQGSTLAITWTYEHEHCHGHMVI